MAWVTDVPETIAHDPAVERTVVEVVAEKIAPMLENDALVYARLPKEYLPGNIIYRAMRLARGRKAAWWCQYDVHQESSMQPYFDRPGALLMEQVTPVPTSSRAQRKDIADRMRARGNLGVFLLRTDDMSMAESSVLDADVVISASDMWLSLEDLRRVFPNVTDELQLQRILRATGGVPGLVAAVPANGDVDAPQLAAVAKDWAYSLLPLVRNNIGLEAMMWTPPISEYSIRKISSQFSPNRVVEYQVAAALASPAVTAVKSNYPAYPGAVGMALCDLAQQSGLLDNRDELLDVAKSDLLPFPDRFSILAYGAEWEEVDALVRERMPWLVMIDRTRRPDILAHFPSIVPAYLEGVDLAGAFLARDPKQSHFRWTSKGLTGLLDLYGLARTYSTLSPLVPGGQDARQPTLLLDHLFKEGGEIRSVLNDPEQARTMVFDTLDTMRETTRRMLDENATPSVDELAMTVAILVVIADLCVDLGADMDADECTLQAQLLLERLGSANQPYQVLSSDLMARRALIAGLAANRDRALMYTQFYRSVGSGDEDDSNHMVRVTERDMLRYSSLPTQIPTRRIEADRLHAGHEAFAATMSIACRWGHDAAVSFARGVLDQANWLDIPSWHLWPLRAAIVSMLTLSGREDEARAQAEAAWFPSGVREMVAGVLAFDKDPAATLATVEHLLVRGRLPERARFIAVGYKIACLLRLKRGEGELAVLVAVEDWMANIALLLALPGIARDYIIAQHQIDVAHLQGLQPQEERTVQELSPRQLEILELLASGLSQRETADELEISPETVKATSKNIYRKLEVGGLADAVRVARAQGWLS